jgi:chaperonin GroES
MLKPLHNRLVVERLESEQTTATGIIIPDTAKEKPQQGRVISVGPGLRDKAGHHVPMDVAVGDTVLFTKYGGADVILDGRDYLILKEDDVLGVMPAGAGRSGAAKGGAGKAAPPKASAPKAGAAKSGGAKAGGAKAKGGRR